VVILPYSVVAGTWRIKNYLRNGRAGKSKTIESRTFEWLMLATSVGSSTPSNT
jgi:hypothetical protein